MMPRSARIAALSGAALALAMLAGCGGGQTNYSAMVNQPAPVLNQIAAPNNQNWTDVVTVTPEGGWRMGNPDAPVKLLEYASITCPHCAEFTHDASTELRDTYVRSGQVSWEYRPVMIFPTDPGTFRLLACQGPQAFFALADQLYATQHDWVGRLQQQEAAFNAAPADARVLTAIRLSGVDQFFRQNGMPAARVDSCLADRGAMDAMLQSSQQAATADRVTGTPTFFINGQAQEGVGYWRRGNPNQTLEPRLRAAVGR